MPELALIVIGLLFDIGGAAVLATPDVPSLRDRHSFGKLKTAQDKLEEDGVRPGQACYEKTVEILENCPKVAEAEEKPNPDYQVIELRRRTGLAASNIDFVWGSEYVEARYEDSDDFSTADFYNVSDVLSELRSEERRTEGLVRAGGLLLMATGFSIQIAGNVVR